MHNGDHSGVIRIFVWLSCQQQLKQALNQWSQWEHKNHSYHSGEFQQNCYTVNGWCTTQCKANFSSVWTFSAMYTIQKIMNYTISWAYVLHIYFKCGLSIYTQNAHTNSISAYATWKIWTKLKLTVSRPFLYAVRFNYLYPQSIFTTDDLYIIQAVQGQCTQSYIMFW